MRNGLRIFGVTVALALPVAIFADAGAPTNEQAPGSQPEATLNREASTGGGVLSSATPSPAPSRALFETPAPTAQDLRVKAAVERGLAHIVSIQESNGAWRNDVGYKLGRRYQVELEDQPHIGVTSLCCMALIANGHTPLGGEYSEAVKAGLEFIINNVQGSGQVTVPSGAERMYSHAFAALLLAEVYGMTQDRRVFNALREVSNFIMRFQVGSGSNKGGWRYDPGQQDADLSITVCQLQALRAARNVGINVPEAIIADARHYITLNYDNGDGAFMYQPSLAYGRSTFALTAAGIVSLQSIGQYESYTSPTGRRIDLRRSFEYLHQNRPDRSSSFHPMMCGFNFWYGHYYAAQAFRNKSNVNMADWQRWNEMNQRNFLAMQRPNGAWIDEIGGPDERRNAFATAMASLILSIPNEYLPIFTH